MIGKTTAHFIVSACLGSALLVLGPAAVAQHGPHGHGPHAAAKAHKGAKKARKEHREAKEARKEAKEARKEAKEARKDVRQAAARGASPEQMREKVKALVAARKNLAKARAKARRQRRQAIRARFHARKLGAKARKQLRHELGKHARRMARLARVRELAAKAKNEEALKRIDAIMVKEQARHNRWMGRHANDK